MTTAIHARACHALGIVCAGVILTAAQGDRDAAAVVRLVELLEIRAGSVVADVGAGSGPLVPPLAARVGKDGRVYATDVNQDRLKELRSLAAKETPGNITVIEGGAAQTNLPENCCDGIFMRLVYHHFGDPPAMNASLRRSLKPGGRLVIVDFTPTAGRSSPPGQRSEGDRHGVTAATVIEELKAAGFEDVQETPWSKAPEFAVVARRPK